MKRRGLMKGVVGFAAAVATLPGSQRALAAETAGGGNRSAGDAMPPYGANEAAGARFEHDGVTLYYETYGEGEPLLLAHGNGLSIGSFAAQIDHFKNSFQVIAMDSRDQGRSSTSTGPITYEKMAGDLAALVEHLGLGPVNVLGWSDGGIEALLLGIYHPAKVKKLIAMGANLNPSEDAAYPETVAMAGDIIAAIPEDVQNTLHGSREFRVTSMLLSEPNIDPAMLGGISAPTLVLSGDHDLIRLEHTVSIFNHIPKANLGIFPNSTHAVPFDDPVLFNATVERFLTTPFEEMDRVGDAIASLGKLIDGLPN